MALLPSFYDLPSVSEAKGVGYWYVKPINVEGGRYGHYGSVSTYLARILDRNSYNSFFNTLVNRQYYRCFVYWTKIRPKDSDINYRYDSSSTTVITGNYTKWKYNNYSCSFRWLGVGNEADMSLNGIYADSTITTYSDIDSWLSDAKPYYYNSNIPITYIPINSSLSGPDSAASGDTVSVDVTYPDGYIYQERGISVYNTDGAIAHSYDPTTGKLTFTMP